MGMDDICLKIKNEMAVKTRSLVVNADKTADLGPALTFIAKLKAEGVTDIAFRCEGVTK